MLAGHVSGCWLSELGAVVNDGFPNNERMVVVLNGLVFDLITNKFICNFSHHNYQSEE